MAMAMAMEIQNLFAPSVPSFLTMFLCIYLFGFFAVFRNWVPKERPVASSCFLSLAHGTPSVVMALHAILETQKPTLASFNTASQNIVLEFSIAYFLVDLLHYIIFYPHDILFISHHLVTLYALMSCRYIVYHGAVAILGLLILAELTSPCQNIWSLAGLRKADVPLAAKFRDFLSPRFFVFYCITRGIMGPLFAFQMALFYVNGEADGTIPRWAWISWMFLTVIIIVVSIVWVTLNWRHWYHDKASKTSHKQN